MEGVTSSCVCVVASRYCCKQFCTEAMGLSASRHEECGTLPGAYAPTLDGIEAKHGLHPPQKFRVTVPEGKKGGDTMVVNVHGESRTIQIPREHNDTGKPYSPGEKFYYTAKDTHKVYASTLPMIPGMEIIQSKPVIWATASLAFLRVRFNDQNEQTQMVKAISDLLERAQNQLLEKAIELECNAVLGMTINIANDSSGDLGNSKLVVVTVCGTPCSVLPLRNLPAVNAEAVVVPLYSDAM